MKTSFEAEKKTWADEKTALTQRAEKAEAALQEATTELSGLRSRVNQMVSAIFGESPYQASEVNHYFDHITCHFNHFAIYSGPRSSNLNQDMLVKLKAVYTLVEQPYTGTQRALAAILPTGQAQPILIDVLKKLSVLPVRFDEIKRSSARAGAVTALSRAKAWVPELDPSEVATGYPSLKEDGTPFDQKDFAACVKEIRPMATMIANDSDLSKYHPAYD